MKIGRDTIEQYPQMADYEYLPPQDVEPPPRTKRAWMKPLATCVILGGMYGAAVGSAISTVPGAAFLIGIATAVLALICGVPGTGCGYFFNIVNRIRFARLFVGTLAALVGAILGGFLGIVVVMPLGATMGAIAGWFFAQAILFRHGLLWRLLGGFGGLVLGTCVGVAVLALRQNEAAALVGIAWGVGIGAVSGALIAWLFVGGMNSLARWRG